MGATDLYRARMQVVEAMEHGHSWQEAATRAGLEISQSTAYRLRQRIPNAACPALFPSGQRESNQPRSCQLRGQQPTAKREKKVSHPDRGQEWLEGAGGLLLLAATQETALLSQLETALLASQDSPKGPQSSTHHLSQPQRRLLLTLVFLNAVGLHRPWDLRTYTGSELGLLTGRPQPYSYRHVERGSRGDWRSPMLMKHSP
jgi:hypothetical protein